jgi:RNA 3'-terminal phosphate cyclase (ATP)
MTSALIQFDGSYGEGGGALVRTALVMASLTQQSCRIEGVRAGTSHPGVDLEDVALVQLLNKACQAEAVGLEHGSPSLMFVPGKKHSAVRGDFMVESFMGRQPNAMVILNALVPLLARTGAYSSLKFQGETFGRRALGFDYFRDVTCRLFAKMGLGVFPELIRAGYGREMPGMVGLEVEPSAIQGINWTQRGGLIGLHGVITTSNLPSAIGDRGRAHLRTLAQKLGLKIDVELQVVPGEHPGAHATVYAVYENGLGGGTQMGSRGVRIETIVQQAFEECARWMATDATIDPFLADQIIIPAVLADGSSSFKVSELTPRLLTAIWVIKQFLPIHITVVGAEGHPGTIQVRR